MITNMRNRLRRYLPILDWGRRYDRATLSCDLVAAVIVTIMLIPQSLAYAMLAGLPPEAGIYASILPIMLVFALYFNKKMGKAFKQNKERVGDINARIEDNLSGIRVVKSFTSEGSELEKFGVENNRYVKSRKNSYRIMAYYHSGLNAFTTMRI